MTAEEMKVWRKRHALTQLQAAIALGYGESTVANWERGFSIPPEVAVICAGLNMGEYPERLDAGRGAKPRYRPNVGRPRRRSLDETLQTRFDKQVMPEPMSGCWLWMGAVGKGYGSIGFGLKNEGAHRVSWMLHKGPIPEGGHVLHNCDNTYCVNPDHLRIGTHAENMADTTKRNRHSKGQYHQCAKLSDEATIEIRKSSEPSRVLATRYGVSYSLVYQIRKNKIRIHLL